MRQLVRVEHLERTARCGEGDILELNQLSLMVIHEIIVRQLGKGDRQRIHILEDVDGWIASSSGLELQEAVVIGQRAVDILDLVAHVIGAQRAARVVDKDGTGGVLDDLLVVIGSHGGHDDLTSKFVFSVVVNGGTVVAVCEFISQFCDSVADKLTGNAIGE